MNKLIIERVLECVPISDLQNTLLVNSEWKRITLETMKAMFKQVNTTTKCLATFTSPSGADFRKTSIINLKFRDIHLGLATSVGFEHLYSYSITTSTENIIVDELCSVDSKNWTSPIEHFTFKPTICLLNILIFFNTENEALKIMRELAIDFGGKYKSQDLIGDILFKHYTLK